MIALSMIVFMGSQLLAQMPAAISIDPPTATAFDELTLTLDVTLSCPDSALFEADSVMMHGGATVDGNAWSNVVAFDAFGANGQQPKLMNNGDSTWSITFIPSEYFGIAAGAEVSAIDCVFNAGDWAAGEGKDFDLDNNCIDFKIPLELLGIANIFDGSFSMYPNPVENQITIENQNAFNKVEIFSVTGQRVILMDNVSTANITINTEDLQSGMYFITMHENNSIKTAKFIKK